ncbi:type II toxin-antitoxin system RelE/ParE family toxin, partial [Klebsiella pneumoniae]
MISWIASTIFGVHYPLRNIRICQTVLRRRLRMSGPGWQMKEIELTPKAEEDLEAIWDFSFRQIGVVQADA